MEAGNRRESALVAEPAQAVDEPGIAAAGIAPRRMMEFASPTYAIPILIILGVALYLVNLGGYPLYTKGEPREAVIVFDIVHGGGVILPARAGVELPSKPLLMHWTAALASLGLGVVDEFTVRLPSAMFAIAAILACYLYVRCLYDERAGLFAALILATSFQFLQAATGARVDMTLTFFMEVAFFEFILVAEGLVQRRMPMYAAIALAVLSKGPVGLVLPAMAAIVWIAVQGKWHLLREISLLKGTILVAVIAGGWYGAAIHAGGWDFVSKQLLTENLYRFVGGLAFHEGHRHRFYYVELALLGGFLPWTALIGILAAQASRRPRPLDSRTNYLLVWFVVVLVFYNFAATKRGVYLLALYPALASMIAVYAADAIEDPSGCSRWISAISRAAGVAMLTLGVAGFVGLAMLLAWPRVLAAALALAGITAPGFLPALASVVSERPIVALAFAGAAEALGIYLLHARPMVARMVVGTAAGMATLTLAANLFVVPAIANTLSLKGFTLHAMELIDGGTVGYLGALNYDIAFYSRRNIPIVSIRDSRLPNYLICSRAVYEAMSARQRDQFLAVITSNPTSLDGRDAIVLLRRAFRPPTPPPPPPKNDTGAIEVRY